MVNFTSHWLGITALVVFVAAYAVSMAEERLHVRKSVPVLIAAGLIWMLVGAAGASSGQSALVEDLSSQILLDFAELLLFLVPAMTFVNTLQERGFFDVLRARLVSSGFSLRAVFWVTGALAFAVSPIADNLTTALLLGTVAMAVGRGNTRFISLACINVVVAANAGGAFSPFGDITTLMVWQAGRVPFADFFGLALPSLVNWLIPALLLSFAIRGHPLQSDAAQPDLEPGAIPVLGLFFFTIVLTVVLHTLLALPPAIGMMAGLALLKGYSYLFNVRHQMAVVDELDDVFAEPQLEPEIDQEAPVSAFAGPSTIAIAPVLAGPPAVVIKRPASRPLDVFALLEKIEWDTLLFFYGVLLGVGGLGALGYLALTSYVLYGQLGATPANVFVGILSAVVDNVPVMFAVLQMSPSMTHGEWLLVTLTTGVGGSLLSIGSAAGIALMGQARGVYTFGAHLRWTWAVALGFAASICVHLVLMNVFQVWS